MSITSEPMSITSEQMLITSEDELYEQNEHDNKDNKMVKFMNAIVRNNLSKVHQMIDNDGININGRITGGHTDHIGGRFVYTGFWTPLAYASRNGYFEMVQLLVENGADININIDEDQFKYPSKKPMCSIDVAITDKIKNFLEIANNEYILK